MSATAIEWATHVWNPFTGCDRVSPGCAHCYALDYAPRLKAMGQRKYQRDGDPKTSGEGFGFTVHWDLLLQPEQFPVGARVFVNSMSDVFHEDAPNAAIDCLFDACDEQPDTDFLILTKRPERMREYVLRRCDRWGNRDDAYVEQNIWLGVSIENRRFVHRADLLRETPAAVRFVSAEPLLGPLVSDFSYTSNGTPYFSDGYQGPELDLADIDWLIVGGESGSKHRRFDPQWARDLRDACLSTRLSFDAEGTPDPDSAPAGTAFFFKQHGGKTPKAGGRELDGRTWDELPRVLPGVAA